VTAVTVLTILAVLIIALAGGVMFFAGHDIARYRRLKRM
jgi:hypothetical protein